MTFDIRSYVITVGMVGGITLLDLLLQKFISPASLVFLYLIASIGAALRFGIGPSLFAAILSLLAFDFVFTEPHYSFSMYHGSDVVNAIVFLFTSVVVSQLVKINKQQNFVLHLRLQRVTLIEEMSKEFLALPPVEQLLGGFSKHSGEWLNVLPLLRTTVLDDISHIVIKYVARVVDQPSFVLFTGQDGKLRVWARSRADAELDPHELTVAEWAFVNGEMAGSGTQTLANTKVFFIPMKSEHDVVGVIGIAYQFKDLLMDQRRLLGSIASLSALGAIRWAKA